ncbi:HD family phosphohydrolase [Desulfonatronum thioautotrophicum]|uniref:HD family phosphohydrolase n=1 Tax=Desulfonatronum thioautotrophicum TaxID=617001 RepID=UPI000A05D83C|nr:HDIG domain-containing metalloprotein [Desulfonatronum thioautotrophicum]
MPMTDTHAKTPAKKANTKTSSPLSSKVGPSPESRFGSLLVFMGCMVLVAALSGLSIEPGGRIFVEGEIAAQDVTAPRDMLIEDQESTRARREMVSQSQPPIFDLAQMPFAQMARRIVSLLDIIASATPETTPQIQTLVAEELNIRIPTGIWSEWSRQSFHNLLMVQILPWLEEAYERGVLADRRFASDITSGMIVRDLSTENEQLHLSPADFPDLDGLMRTLDLHLRTSLNLPVNVRRAVEELLTPLLRPNLTPNQEATQARMASAVQSVDPVFYQIKKGEMIVRKGERVTAEQQQKMQAVFAGRDGGYDWDRFSGVLLLSLIFSLAIFQVTGKRRQRLTTRDALLLASVMFTVAAMAKLVAMYRFPLSRELLTMTPDIFVYSLPVAGAAGVLALFFPLLVCIFSGALMAFLCTQMLQAGFDLFLFYLIGAVGCALLLRGAQTRTDILRSSLPLLGLFLGTWAALNLLDFQGFSWFMAGSLFSATGAILSILLLLAFSPVVEYLFGYTSRFKLLEMMSLDQPLLQSLMVNAPGTYHHCLIVANMAEAGAKAIGANPLLAKVAALYHDIGKIKNPHYFIENQFGCENRHDKLAPSMSALILISHVKKGVELATEHKLGSEITDLIQQHHGSRLIVYFYQKAQKICEGKGLECVREDDFRYPGPKPQSKEAGIILLADAIEASSRTLVDPTPSRVRNHIQNLVRAVFNEGQLDDSDLSLKDLSILSETFQRILTGIFHQRIDYPKVGAHAASPPPRPEAARGIPHRFAPAR